MKKSFLSRVCFAVSLFGSGFLLALPPSEPVIPQVAIPLLQQSPGIDGRIEEAEWAQCMRLEGMMQTARQFASRDVIFWLGADTQKIYIAMRSEVPEVGSLLNRVKAAGSADRKVHQDDCIEIWLAPVRVGQAGRQKYYQIAVNPEGALFDILYDPANEQLPAQPAWRVNWEYAGQIHEDGWHAEIAIPLAELEAEPEDLENPWGIRIGRNWRQPSSQTEWAPRIGGFADMQTMSQVRWQPEGGPLVRMLNMRHQDGSIDLQLQLQNRSAKTCSLKAEIYHRVSDNPHHDSQQLYTLEPGASEMIRIRESILLGGAQTYINITDPEGRITYFKRAFQWQVERDSKRWQTSTQDIRAVSLDVAYYPSYQTIKAKVDMAGLDQREQVKGAKLQLHSSSNVMLAETRFPPIKNDTGEVIFKIPELSPGEYVLSLFLEGDQVPADPVKQTIVHRDFPWENHSLGYTEEVIPPFTRLQVQGNQVHSVLRRHTISPFGLWEQISSRDEDLLQKPMRFEIRAGGKMYQPQSSQPIKFTSVQDHQVTYQTAWQAGPLRAQLQGTFEIDGMLKIVLDLQQDGDEPVEAFDLVLPLKHDYARLLHACGPGLRSNYAGNLPEGEGLVWDSKKTGSHLVGYFVPYLWLGEEGRGIAWFAESDRDWLYDDSKCPQSIERLDDCVEMRIHFVLQSAALKRPRQWVFALQATPSKPMPGEPHSWRNWVSRTTDEGKDPESWRYPGPGEQQHWRNWVSRTNRRFSPRAFTHFMLAGSSSWGTDSGHAFIYPVNRDFYVYDLLQEARREGKRNLEREAAWFSRYDPKLPESELKSRHDHIRWATRNLAGQPDAVVPYTDPRASVFNPEFETYQDEWLVTAYSSRNWDFSNPRGAVAYRVSPGKSFQDYHLWYMQKMLETFADAIYFDNTYLLATEDIMQGAYYADDGSLRPAVDIFNMREHIKRTQIMTWKLGKNWLASMNHMTNAQIVPINTWCGTNLDWEWKYGGEDFQNRFSRDMIRTTAIGQQTGSVPFVLGTTGIRGQFTPERRKFLYRSLLGCSLVHEIKNLSCEGLLGDIYAKLFDFGYGSADCRVYRYWDKDYPLQIGGVDAVALVLVKGSEALMLVVSYDEDGTADIRINPEKLDLKKGGQFINVESEAVLPASGQGLGCQAPLPKHDFVLIHYR